jgi:hypothetical protein
MADATVVTVYVNDALVAENERLRALVAEARAMFEWLSVAESHLASDAWLADYIAKSAVERPAVAGGDSVDTLDRFECAFCGKKFATAYVRGHHQECCDKEPR